MELCDVMPTVLDIAGVPAPGGIDGRSVLPLMDQASEDWREDVHGEHVHDVFVHQSIHYVTDGHRTFIWYSGLGTEQFFDLDADPTESHNLVDDPDRADEVEGWRQRLFDHLTDPEEGYVVEGQLVVGRPAHSERAWVRERLASLNDHEN